MHVCVRVFVSFIFLFVLKNNAKNVIRLVPFLARLGDSLVRCFSSQRERQTEQAVFAGTMTFPALSLR